MTRENIYKITHLIWTCFCLISQFFHHLLQSTPDSWTWLTGIKSSHAQSKALKWCLRRQEYKGEKPIIQELHAWTQIASDIPYSGKFLVGIIFGRLVSTSEKKILMDFNLANSRVRSSHDQNLPAHAHVHLRQHCWDRGEWLATQARFHRSSKLKLRARAYFFL
jgi:hypothetical protein